MRTTNRAVEYSGGCLCGAIRFIVRGLPQKPHTCSCLQCRKHTGGLTAAWVEFPKEAVNWIGKDGAPATFRSSKWSSRAFCKNCGSSLGAIDDAPMIAFLVGAFDKPHLKVFQPITHSYRGQRPKWWCVDTTS